MTKLTDRQQTFVDKYVECAQVGEAADAADYNHSYASQLLSKPKIRKAIASARKQVQERTQITQDMVAEGLLEEATRDDDDGGGGADNRAVEHAHAEHATE